MPSVTLSPFPHPWYVAVAAMSPSEYTKRKYNAKTVARVHVSHFNENKRMQCDCKMDYIPPIPISVFFFFVSCESCERGRYSCLPPRRSVLLFVLYLIFLLLFVLTPIFCLSLLFIILHISIFFFFVYSVLVPVPVPVRIPYSLVGLSQHGCTEASRAKHTLFSLTQHPAARSDTSILHFLRETIDAAEISIIEIKIQIISWFLDGENTFDYDSGGFWA